jgi:hypothetical protein
MLVLRKPNTILGCQRDGIASNVIDEQMRLLQEAHEYSFVLQHESANTLDEINFLDAVHTINRIRESPLAILSRYISCLDEQIPLRLSNRSLTG